jgi:hypothetical protein
VILMGGPALLEALLQTPAAAAEERLSDSPVLSRSLANTDSGFSREEKS